MTSVPTLFSLEGRTALVTGGAGELGRAMAMALGGAGARILLMDIDRGGLDAACDALDGQGIRAQGVAADLEDEAAALATLDGAISEAGRLDILVNNAAFVGTSNLAGWNEPFERQSSDTWRRALEVNLTMVFALTQRAAPALRASGAGSVINISSIYGLVGPDYALYEGLPMNNPAAYNASKGGLVQLTRWLATTMAPNVRVNAIAPGGILRGQPETFVKRYAARTPLRRMANVEDFQGTALFLASDASAYITGVTLPVDGGWTAW